MPAPLAKVALYRLKRPFESDGCTAWPDGPWVKCCERHDRAYRYGKLWGMTRKRADRELRDCIASLGYPVQARLMYIGVRLFGKQYWQEEPKDFPTDMKA